MRAVPLRRAGRCGRAAKAQVARSHASKTAGGAEPLLALAVSG